jgi:hypothetical protein
VSKDMEKAKVKRDLEDFLGEKDNGAFAVSLIEHSYKFQITSAKIFSVLQKYQKPRKDTANFQHIKTLAIPAEPSLAVQDRPWRFEIDQGRLL